jgi:hypothetical protein
MKKYIVLAGLALVLACSEKEESAAAPEGAAPEAMPADAGATPAAGGGVPGTYDATRPDGTTVVATLNADGTYQREMDGTVEKGTWVAKGNQTCFDPEGDAPESCNTRGPAAADGSFESTNPQGEVSKVVPRS